MKLFCVDKNLNELSCSVLASVISEEKINGDITKYTVRFENKGEEISCIPTVEIRRKGKLNFYMIPCVIYNGNDFGEVIEVQHGYDPYFGPYEVIPKAWQDQILPTTGKNMEGDVTVFEIPYSEVSNPDGTTIVIAS